MMIALLNQVENTMEKGENVGNQEENIVFFLFNVREHHLSHICLAV